MGRGSWSGCVAVLGLVAVLAGRAPAQTAASPSPAPVGDEGPPVLKGLVTTGALDNAAREGRVVFKPGKESFTRELHDSGPGARVDVTIPVPRVSVVFEGVNNPVKLPQMELGITVSKLKNDRPESDFGVTVQGLGNFTIDARTVRLSRDLRAKVVWDQDPEKPGRVNFSVLRAGLAPAERARRRVKVEVEFKGATVAFTAPCQTTACRLRQVWGIVKPRGDLVIPYLAAAVLLIVIVFVRDNAFRALVSAQGWPVHTAAVWASAGSIMVYAVGFGLLFTTLPQVPWGGVGTTLFWGSVSLIGAALAAVVVIV